MLNSFGINNTSLRRIAIYCGVGLALLLVVLLVTKSYYLTDNNVSPKVSKHNNNLKVVKTELLTVDISAFPKDFPFEAGSNVIQNYRAKGTNVQAQTTRIFETKKTLDENYVLFTQYFKQNSWQTLDTKNDASYKFIIAKRDNVIIQITITENQLTKFRTVETTIFK